MIEHGSHLLLAILVTACATHEEDAQAEPPTLDLAANQIVLGERITFAGKNGKPVVTKPGVYRVGARGDDTLELYFGKSRKPYALVAKKASVDLSDPQRAVASEPKAVLPIPNDATPRMPVDIVVAAAGYRHSVAIGWEWGATNKPVLLTWGDNDDGQVSGSGAPEDHAQPTQEDFR